MIHIRQAAESDIPRILEIENEAISPPWSHGALLSEIFSEKSFFALAVENGDVLGFVILRCSDEEAQLLQIAVCGQNRRRGIANMLMTAALDHVAKNSPMKFFLEVRESNIAAIRLYKQHKLATIAVRKDYYTHPIENAIVMMREI